MKALPCTNFITFDKEFILSLRVGWLVVVLARSKVISGWVLTCDSAHSWRIDSAATLGNQVTDTMIRYPALSWHWADQCLPYPINAEHQARQRQGTLYQLSIHCQVDPQSELQTQCTGLINTLIDTLIDSGEISLDSCSDTLPSPVCISSAFKMSRHTLPA